MNSPSLTFWDRVQLLFLRLLSLFLGLMDRLFGVNWGQRLLERQASRWQSQLTRLNEAIARLEQERAQLESQIEALAIHTAAIYLAGRSLTGVGLRFDPALPRDEEILTASIDLLVKNRLAAVEIEEVGPQHYLYTLEPDWPAIRARIADAAVLAEPEVADWLREGLNFIESVVSSQ